MPQKKFLYFVHVERAGGTTLHRLIQHTFPTYLPLRPWWCWANEPENSIGAEELSALVRWLPGIAGVGGHTTRPWLDCEHVTRRDVMRFTFLRDPIARYMSHFNYQRVRMDRPWTIDQFLDEERFSNYHTKRFAGRFDLEAAKQALDESFDFVGLTDHFDKSLLLLRQELGQPEISVQYERQNALPEDRLIRFDDLDDAQQNRVRAVNQLDIDLYRHAVEKVFPRFVDRYPGNLSADVERFQEANRTFRYSTTRTRLLSPWIRIAKRIVEPILHARHDNPRPVVW